LNIAAHHWTRQRYLSKQNDKRSKRSSIWFWKSLGGFREIPIACLTEAENILNRLAEIGLYGTVVIGKPNQPVVQIPVSSGYAGLVILAGLNPLGAVEEIGISTQNSSLCIMMDYKKLTPLD